MLPLQHQNLRTPVTTRGTARLRLLDVRHVRLDVFALDPCQDP